MNIITNLPVPVGANGSGAAVDTSNCGANKYVVVDGSWTLPDRPPTVTIEINNDAVPNGTWAPLFSFVGNGKKMIPCAARWLRATVSNYRGGTNPEVNFGSTDDPCTFVTPAVPAGNGVGAASNITALPEFKTVTIGDSFAGQVILEYSEDNAGTDWAELPAMSAPGEMSFPLIAKWIRVRRQGIPTSATAGTPIVNLGGVSPSSGGGIDTIGVNVEEDGVAVLTPAQTLNFTGMVAVTDAGGDTADVAVGAFEVTAVLDSTDSPIAAAIGQLVRIDPTIGAVGVTLPAIAAGNEGLMIAIKAVEYNGAGFDITITPTGADTIDGEASFVIPANRIKYGLVLVSDGAGNWEQLAAYQKTPSATYYEGDGAPDITLNDGDTAAIIASTGDAEGTQTFIVPDGRENGQTLSIVAASSGFGMVVEVPSPGGEAGMTNTLAATTQGSLLLVWHTDSWYTVSIIGFVNS